MELDRYEIVDKNYSKRDLYIGKKINKLFIHDIVRVRSKSNSLMTMAIVSCECNPDKKLMVSLFALLDDNIKSCGCVRIENNLKQKGIPKQSLKVLGEKFITNQGYTIEVIAVAGRHDITVRFLNTKKGEEYETHTTVQNVKKGQVRYPYHRNKWGGYYGVGKYTARENGIKTDCYNIWNGMLFRCYDDIKQQKCYKNTKVCKAWKNFQNFAEWYYSNTYTLEDGEPTDIDKDLLSYIKYKNKKKKVYSPDTCLILPQSINSKIICISEGFSKNRIDDLIEYTKTYESKIPITTYTKLIDSLNSLYELNNDKDRSKKPL